MPIVVGRRVRHRSFGEGMVKTIKHTVTPSSVLVKWDTHRRKKPIRRHPLDETHVKITSLRDIG